MARDYKQMALDIVKYVGGEENINVVEHCMTRLRFELVDSKKADKERLNQVEGVIEARESGAQYQIIIGTHVDDVYEALLENTNIRAYRQEGAESENVSGNQETKNKRFDLIGLISSIFLPIMGVFIGASVIKGILVLVTGTGILSEQSTTYAILNAAGDGFYYFLPIFLAITAAKKFDANKWVAIAIAAALCHPTITALGSEEAVTLFGIPISIITYTSSVFPILLAVGVQSKVEKFLKKIVPKVVESIIVPAVTIVLMVSLTLIVVGPVTDKLGSILVNAILKIMDFSPLLAGFIAGVLGPIETIFGLHWAMLPIILNNFATLGYDFFAPLTLAWTFVVTGVTLAIFLKTKNKDLKEVSMSACIVSVVGGITEPGLYGVLLKYKRVFIAACIVNGLGGAWVAANAIHVTAIPSLNIITAPAYVAMCGNPMLIYLIAMPILGFLVTYFISFKDKLIK